VFICRVTTSNIHEDYGWTEKYKLQVFETDVLRKIFECTGKGQCRMFHNEEFHVFRPTGRQVLLG
jgi:hypothetical protein